VLASGRHYESIIPFARELHGVEWILSAQGGEVSDVDRRTIVFQRFLDRALAESSFALGQKEGFSVVIYGVDDIFVSAEDRGDKFYSNLSGRIPVRRPVAQLFEQPIFKIIWVGEGVSIDRLTTLTALDDLRATKVRTHQKIFEILPPDVSKGVGMAALADRLGISAAQAVAFGDAENDIPLFEWAGTSIAMPHGWPTAQKHATAIGPEASPETAFARAVDLALSGNLAAKKLAS
jgi:Cof subfamily protein (haloacid dehalogenase superfamily)